MRTELNIHEQIDFIQPEFLNILFFQQKSLVIYPYVDLKYLYFLEFCTVGYNVTPLDGITINNLKEVIEFEVSNNDTHNKTFYFVYNVDHEKLSEIMKINEFRCIINTNENVTNLVNGTDFIFYNKKNNRFLNFKPESSDLKLEEYLISTSPNRAILQNKIQEIMSLGTIIFTELNENLNLDNIAEILKDYDQQYWEKILKFVENYYKIEIPDIDFNKNKIKNRLENLHKVDQNEQIQEFSNEYQTITSENKFIAREFIQLLLEYRSQHVNLSNLDLEQLYDPQKLYIYLRNHQWKKGISKDFLTDWVKMKKTGYNLSNDDKANFSMLFNRLFEKSLVEYDEPRVREVKKDSIRNLKPKKEKKLINPTQGQKPKIFSTTILDISEMEKKMIEKLESEIDIVEQKIICVVDKGPVIGKIYVCPKCKAFHCLRCANALQDKNEGCWACKSEFKL